MITAPVVKKPIKKIELPLEPKTKTETAPKPKLIEPVTQPKKPEPTPPQREAAALKKESSIPSKPAAVIEKKDIEKKTETPKQLEKPSKQPNTPAETKPKPTA